MKKCVSPEQLASSSLTSHAELQLISRILNGDSVFYVGSYKRFASVRENNLICLLRRAYMSWSPLGK